MAQRVREIMTSNPTTVRPESPVTDAARLMGSEDVGSLPVVEGDMLVGVVTDRDITVRVVAEGKDPNATTVGDIHSSDPVTVRADQGLDEALNEMARHQVRRLPVVEGERLVGVLAQADVARSRRRANGTSRRGDLGVELGRPRGGGRQTLGLVARIRLRLLREDDAAFCAQVSTVDQAAAITGVSAGRLTGREALWSDSDEGRAEHDARGNGPPARRARTRPEETHRRHQGL